MKPREESGFALLLVFVLAASIAIGLYMELPRVAFESQRSREQLSIDGGMQYQRAVQLFYRKYRAYPQTLDDLETTRNIRFLRKRYKDPLTGKEYRLLHVGPAGQLTDSLIQSPNSLPGGGSSGAGSTGLSASNGTTSTSPPALGPDGQPIQTVDPLNMAAKRPSDRILTSALQLQQQPQQPEPDPNQDQPPAQYNPPPQQIDPGQTDPNQQPNPAQPGQVIQGQPVYPGQPQDPSQGNPSPGQPLYPGQQPSYPGQPPVPGQPFQPNPSQIPPQFPAQPTPYPAQPGGAPPGMQPNPTPYSPFPAGGNQNPGQNYNPFQQSPGQIAGMQGGIGGGVQAGIPGQAQNQAANLIQTILTTPRQPPASIAGLSGGNAGGIVGVASNAEGKGIHKVKDHNKYKEWEFVYDIKNDKTALGAAAVPQQQQLPGAINPNIGTPPVTGATPQNPPPGPK